MSTSPDPANRLLAMIRGYRQTQLLHAVATLKVADHLSAGPRSASELARDLGVDADALYRVLRALAAEGVFEHAEDDRFSLTAASELLRSDKERSLHAAACLHGAPWWWQAWGALVDTVRTGRTAFDVVHDADFFSYLGAHPDAGAAFDAGMQTMTAERAEAIAKAYDFSSARRIIDVGGGRGALAAAIAQRHPGVRATVFDAPSVVGATASTFADRGLADRCDVIAGSFFEAVPEGADAYVLKDILHDWDDERALSILRNVRRAARAHGRVLVVERLIVPGATSTAAKQVDISMLVMTGGRERSYTEYADLFGRAGLDAPKVHPVDAETSILESASLT